MLQSDKRRKNEEDSQSHPNEDVLSNEVLPSPQMPTESEVSLTLVKTI